MKKISIAGLNPTILLFSLVFLFYICFSQRLVAMTNLTVEDETAMSQMVKNSHSIDELRLCQKLFPHSPFYSTFQKRIIRLEKQNFSGKSRQTFSEFSKNYDSESGGMNLNVNDEVVLSRLVENSNSARGFKLFIKLFPYSAYSSHFRQKLLKVKKGEVVEKDEDSLKDIEEQVLDEIEEKASAEKAIKKKEEKAEEKLPEKKKEEKAEPKEKEAPEQDWAKIEIGIPTQLKIMDSDDAEVDTTDSPVGIYIGWSSEVWLDMGGGAGLEYLTIELDSNGDELQHLFFDVQIRGRLFGFLNWGIAYGNGLTTLNKKNKPDNLEIIPGQGVIQILSVGVRYGSFGLNYLMGSFDGSYQWTTTDGLSITTGNENWKGTVNMIAIEYLY